MSDARYFGALSYWNEAEGFGEILVPGSSMAPVVVYRRELKQGGIAEPAVGVRVMFSLGSPSSGASGAVNVQPDPRPAS